MADLATAYLQLLPSLKGASKAISSDLAGTGDSAGNQLGEKMGGGILGKMKGIAAPLAGTFAAVKLGGMFSGFVGEATNASDATDKFKQTLQFAGLKNGTIDSLTKSTKSYADSTVYSLGDVQNVTAQLAANSVKDYDKLAMAAGNLNAVAGGGADTFKSVSMVLTQTAGAGKLTTENWNQLADAIPGASGILQNEMKKSGAYTGDFRKAMADGQITADEFNASIMELGMTDVAKKAATSTKTIEGAWGGFKASVVSGLSVVISTFKPMITSFLTMMADGAEKGFGALARGAEGIGPAFSKFSKIVKPAITAVIVGFNSLKPVISSLVASLIPSFERIKTSIANMFKGAGGDGGVSLITIAFSSLKSVIQTLTPIVSAAATVFSQLFSFITSNIGTITAIVAPIAGVVAGLAGLSAAAGAVSGFAGFGATLGIVIGKFKELTLVTNIQKAAQAAWNGVQIIASGITKTFTLAQAGLNAVLALNPYVKLALVLAALVAGIVIAYKNSETFRNFINSIGPAIVAAWGSVISWVTGTLIPMFATAWVVIKAGMSAFGSFFTSVWNGIKAVVGLVWQGIVLYVTTYIAAISTVITTTLTAISVVWTTLWNGFRAIVQGVWNGISGAIQASMSMVSSIVSATMSAVRTVWTSVWNSIRTYTTIIWNSIRATISDVVNSVRVIVESVVNAIRSTVTTIWNAIRAITTSVWNGIRSVISAVMSGIRSVVSANGQGINATLTAAWNAIRSVTSAVWNAIRSTISAVMSGIRSVVSSAMSGIVSVMSTSWNVARGIVSSAWSGISGAVRSGVSSMMSIVRGIPGQISGALGSLGGMLTGSGRALIQGFVNGILSMVGAARSAASNVMSAVKDFFPHSPAKEGPFSGSGWRAVMSSGATVGKTWASGLESSVSDVRSASSNLMSGVNLGTNLGGVSLSGAASNAAGPGVVQNISTMDPTAAATLSNQWLGRALNI